MSPSPPVPCRPKTAVGQGIALTLRLLVTFDVFRCGAVGGSGGGGDGEMQEGREAWVCGHRSGSHRRSARHLRTNSCTLRQWHCPHPILRGC